MENENKNTSSPVEKNDHTSQNHAKNKPQRRKSYFIGPGTEKQKDQKSSAPAPTQSQQKENKPVTVVTNQSDQQAQSKNRHGKNSPRGNKKANHAQSTNQQERKPSEVSSDSKKVKENIKTPEQAQPKVNGNTSKSRHRHKNQENKRREEKDLRQNNNTAPDVFSDEQKSTLGAIPLHGFSDKLQPQPQKTLEKISESPEYAQYSDYEEFSVADLYGDKREKSPAITKNNNSNTVDIENEPTVEVVGIRFKPSGKTYYFAPNGITLKTGSHAIVETARGLEYGEVSIGNSFVKESETVQPIRPVIRKATEADVKHHIENTEKETEAFRICNEKIISHELDMKLIDAQYTFDNSKLLFYFTSSGRVDFRDLVKDLASVFRTRIELRQIGIRDEAKMVGGLGMCGRPLCCTLFLSDFGQVSIKMAKEQNLSLNSSKISGICGRLMCCLRYEHETYEYEIKRTPPVDSLVRTVDGIGVVTEINPLAATIKVKLTSSPDTPPQSYNRNDVTVLKKKSENS